MRLIQWVSHKWGIPTDRVRAQMHLESRWSMDMLGDRSVQDDMAQYLAAPAYARVPSTLDVYESLGISQVRWHPDHVASGLFNPHPGTEPLRWLSTAFNLDYYGATVRFYLDDPEGRRTNWGDGSYVPGDYATVQGGWFNPYPWGNAPMLGYVASIESRLEDKPWLLANFTDVAGLVTVYRQPAVTRNGFGFVTARPEVVAEAWVPPTPPVAAPTSVAAAAGDTTITVTWGTVAPADNGGAPILGYMITEHDEGWAVDHPFTTGSITLTGLPNGTAHRFNVRAYNEVGTGPASAASNSATPAPATVPGAPTGVGGTAGDARAILTWTPPASTGGSPITGYRIVPRIAGVAQTPIDTLSATPGFTVTGLTNGTAYTFIVRALNSVGASADSAASSAITPTAPAGLDVPPEMPIISRGLTAVASGDFDPALAISADYGDTWSSYPVLPSVSTPATYSLDIRGVSGAAKTTVWCVLTNITRPSWNRSGALGPGGVGTNKMRNYKLRAHASSSSSEPAIGDAGWVDLVTVTDNRFSDRIHAPLDLHTYGWFQVFCTESTGGVGVGNNGHAGFHLELRDASAAAGNEDAFAVYGDSMVHEGQWYRVIDGTKYPVGNGPLQGALEVLNGRDPPVIWTMAEGGYTSGTAVTVISGRPEYEYIIDAAQPCRYLILQYGIAEANLVSADMASLSPSGVNSTPAQAFKTQQQAVIDYAVAQGMQVIVPYLVASHNNSFTKPNIVVLNAIIDQLVAANPGDVYLGPDLFTFFDAHPTAFYDSLHPTWNASAPGTGDALTGYEHILALYRDWLQANVYT
jgi:hypothetical protein